MDAWQGGGNAQATRGRLTVLDGQTVLVTRTREQYASTARLIRQAGGTPLCFPCLRLMPCEEEIRRGMQCLHQYSDVLFTSVNAVKCVAQTMARMHHDACAYRAFAKHRLVCVGAKTTQAARKVGWRVDLQPPPESASQQGLIALYDRHGWPASLAFFRAAEGGEEILQACATRGIETMLTPAYHMACPTEDASETRNRLRNGDIDIVLLGSSRTARHYAQRIADPVLANRAAIVVISSQVAQAAREVGLSVAAVADVPCFPAMLRAAATLQ